MRAVDHTGKRYGLLTAIRRTESRSGAAYWVCRCDCGRDTTVRATHLRIGDTASCGCASAHGHARARQQSREYVSWARMKTRCFNEHADNYAYYGGRGITVCDRWRDDFAAFLADMGPKPSPAHSIERIDNDGHYEPGNCRWATKSEQARNRRRPAA